MHTVPTWSQHSSYSSPLSTANMMLAVALCFLIAAAAAEEHTVLRGSTPSSVNVDPRALQIESPIVTNPSCSGAPLIFDGDVTPMEVIFTEDISCGDGTALSIVEPNVILDCRGFNLRRSDTFASNGGTFDPNAPSTGFFVTGAGIHVEAENVTIQNCNVLRFNDGIVIDMEDSLGSVVIENVTAAGNTANGVKSFGDLTVSGSIFMGNGRTGISIMEGTATITSTMMDANGGSGAYVNDAAEVEFFESQLNRNGAPQVWGQGVGLAVAPESMTALFQTELCGNKDDPFRVIVPKEGVDSGLIQVEMVTCDGNENCDFACDAIEFSRSAPNNDY